MRFTELAASIECAMSCVKLFSLYNTGLIWDTSSEGCEADKNC